VTDRVSYYSVTVSAVNTGASTFDATTGDGALIQGIASNPQNLPAVGMQVTLFLMGATVLYRPEGIAAASVGTPQVSAIGASKLSSDTVTANLTLASQILTATAGQRAGITAMGLQAWDSSNNLTVSLTGVTNLLTGTTQTAASGRRVVFGAGGDTSQVVFYGADGTEGKINSFAVGGVESLRVATPIESTFEGWNGATFQSDERATLNSGRIDVAYGGDTAAVNQRFSINQATTSGSPGSAPTLVERFRVDPSRVRLYGPDIDTQHEITSALQRFWVGSTASDGSVDIVPHGVVDTRSRSPRIQLRAEGGTQASNLKYVIDSGSANPRIEVTNTADTGYGAIWASAFTVSSSATDKDQIADLQGSALAKVRGLRPRTYRRISRGGKIRGDDGRDVTVPESVGPVEVGLVAEEAPPEIVVGQSEAIDLYPLLTLTVAAVKELDAKVTALEQRGKP
jgi:hypothetical protein